MDSKKLCPFKEKCYRKNPIHFEEMSHPHLEKLLNGQLTGDINLPSDLEFDCPDRSELVDQLKVLQLTLRKKKPSENPSAVTETKQALKRVSEPSTSSATKKSKDSSSPKKSSSKESPPAGKSIFDAFNSCTADKARIQVRNSAIERMQKAGQQVPHLEPIGQFDLKYALSAPYHLFLACVQKVPETWSQPYSVTFPEILDISLGTIEESLHFNFMVDVGWLCLQYLFAGQKADSQIFLGSRCDDLPLPSNIKTIKIETPTAFGTHHSKVSVLKYTNGGARVVISTANLYSDDWDNRTQAVWISPHLPKLTDESNSSGEAPTGFKRDFSDYLREYKNPALEKWISLLQTLDFSSVNVCFVASVPGTHRNATRSRWGLRKLASILSEHADPPAEAAQWPIVAQASSIGSLGPNYDAWLTREFVPAMASLKSQGLRSAPNFKFVYPSINNFKDSFDMRVGCCCLPYSKRVHDKQPWLNKYLYQWKAGNKSRNRAIPHSKTYIRLSPDLKKVPWAVVTSGNLSKAAWGYGQTSTTILNYEVGVVFLPKFLFKAKTIPIKEQDDQGNPVFPLPYDLPLTPYASDDKPFVMEFFNV